MLLFSYQFISIKCNYNSCVCFISASKKQPVLIASHACTKPSSKSFPVFPLCNVVCFCIYFSVVCSVHSCFWRCVCVWFFFFPPPKLLHLLKEKEKALTNHAFDISNSYTCKCFLVCALFFSNNFFIFCTVMHHTTVYTKRVCDHYRKLLQQNMTWVEIHFWSHLKH